MEAFLVILTLAALAFVVGSPKRFRPTRRRSAVNTFITVWGSVLLGAILGPTVTGVIPAAPLNNAKPLAVLGLGWIGVMVGSQARRGLLAMVPRRIWTVVIMDLCVTTAIIAPLAYFGLRIWLVDAHPAELLAISALIAAAALGWAMETRSTRDTSSPEAHRLAILIRASGGLLAIASIIVVGAASIVTNTQHLSSKAIATATLVVVAVISALLLKFAISITSGRRGDQLAVFMGAVGLAAGTAAEIGLSPLFAALLAGMAIANMPGQGLRSFEAFILRGEHIVAALFGLMAGILIDIRIGTAGLALAMAIVAARLLLKPTTLSLALRASGDVPDARLPGASSLYLSPIRVSPVAIALGVSLVVLAPTQTNGRVLTVILLAGVMSEAVSIALTASGVRRTHPSRAAAA